MIVWFNCKISDIRPNPQPRYNLRNDNRFDIARYSFASFSPLEPLVSKFIFNLEMADGHAGQEAEMEQWLRGIFPADKLSIHWYRCNNIAQWREVQAEMNAINDDIVFPAGNEDHIFVDSDISLFAELLETLKASTNPAAAIMTSHWPESIRAAHHFGCTKQGNAVLYSIGNNDAIRVIKKSFFNWYLDQIKDPNAFIFRTEHWNSYVLPNNLLIIPTKEQFRHFDGYAHVGIGPEYVPPLEIPPGFFEKNITIRYGFDSRDQTAVNINPLADKLYAEDINGTDYKWTLEDVPAFWKPYIKNTIINPETDNNMLAEARDTNLLLTSRLQFGWPHFGIKFDETNCPPVDWLNPHMQMVEFAD